MLQRRDGIIDNFLPAELTRLQVRRNFQERTRKDQLSKTIFHNLFPAPGLFSEIYDIVFKRRLLILNFIKWLPSSEIISVDKSYNYAIIKYIAQVVAPHCPQHDIVQGRTVEFSTTNDYDFATTISDTNLHLSLRQKLCKK